MREGLREQPTTTPHRTQSHGGSRVAVVGVSHTHVEFGHRQLGQRRA